MNIEKLALGFFPTFLVLKNGNLWRLLRRICKQTILYLQSTPNTPYTPDTLNTPNTSNSDTDTPLPPDTAVSSFSGSGISWFENRLFPNRHCDLLIASLVSEWSSRETEMRFGVCALMGESIFNFLIRWLPEQSIGGDAETPIDGHTLMVTGTGRVYFKSHTSIFTYLFINQSFYRTDRRNRQRYPSVQHQTSGRITWLVYQQRGGYPYWRT